MSSNRLPSKVLRIIHGRVLLGHVIDRLRRSQAADGIWIATSTHPSDDAIAAFAAAEGIDVYRGSLDDVAGRLIGAAEAARAGALVRISADSPLIDPSLVDQAITLFRQKRPDLVTNVLRRTFPKGQSVEVVALSALKRAYALMSSAEEREHVTPWFYANRDAARIESFETDPPRGTMQLSVDTAADFTRVDAILARLGPPAWSHGLNAVVAAAAAIDAPAAES